MSERGTLRALRRAFPDFYDPSSLLEILFRFVDKRSTSRTYAVHAAIIELAEGSTELLEELVEIICSSPWMIEPLKKWAGMKHSRRNYPNANLYPIVGEIAASALRHEFDLYGSNGCIVLRRDEDGPALVLVPVLTGEVFVTEDPAAVLAGKTIEQLSQFPGQFHYRETIRDVVDPWLSRSSSP